MYVIAGLLLHVYETVAVDEQYIPECQSYCDLSWTAPVCQSYCDLLNDTVTQNGNTTLILQ